MICRLWSVANWGLEPAEIEIEVDVSARGLPGMTLVGLAGKATEEAKDRVRLAIANSGFDFPNKKIVVNLAPADLPKEGSAYDLPIAMGVLFGAGLIPKYTIMDDSIFFGELALDGSLRHTRGVLPAAIGAKSSGRPKLYIPRSSAAQAGVVSGVEVYPVTNLAELVRHFQGQTQIKPLSMRGGDMSAPRTEHDLSEVVGQLAAKRAVEITAAGGHNLLMSGPPGSGKTMLARCLAGILPQMSLDEKLTVTQIHSLAGLVGEGQALIHARPFRSPHRSISSVGLIGGGSRPRPGEISMAHLGVLFLDEMAEFPRLCLESLRQPLEDGVVHIVRSAGRLSFPAQFSLVGAINPCQCGFRGHPNIACQCTPRQIQAYQQKLSGPILDRIDLRIWVPVQSAILPLKMLPGESSEKVRQRVEECREIQRRRLSSLGKLTNAQMSNQDIRALCKLDGEVEQMLEQAATHYQLSTRALMRVIKVARTIADLERRDQISVAHVSEAVQYRVLRE